MTVIIIILIIRVKKSLCEEPIAADLGLRIREFRGLVIIISAVGIYPTRRTSQLLGTSLETENCRLLGNRPADTMKGFAPLYLHTSDHHQFDQFDLTHNSDKSTPEPPLMIV